MSRSECTELVGREHVLAGKTYTGGVMLAPGHILSGTKGKETIIGELDGTLSPRVQRIAAAFNHAGLATEVSDNILGTMWDKLLVNVATGALGVSFGAYAALADWPPVAAIVMSTVVFSGSDQ